MLNGKVFSMWIDRNNDVVDVTVPNSSIRAEVSNLAGTGCPSSSANSRRAAASSMP